MGPSDRDLLDGEYTSIFLPAKYVRPKARSPPAVVTIHQP